MAQEIDYFNSICKVSRAFGTTLKKKELLNLVVSTAIDTMKAKAACLFLADEEKDLFVPVAQKGLSKDYLHTAPEKAKKTVAALLKKGHLSIYDATTDKKMEHRDAKKKEGIASILVVPVMVHGKAVGVLTLYTGEHKRFTRDEIAFLTALAEQGGIAIDRARLIENIRRSTKLFHDLSVSINQSLDIKHIMKTLTVDLASAFKSKAASVQLLDVDQKTLKFIAGHGLSKSYLDKYAATEEKGITDTLNGETTVIRDAVADKRVMNPGAYKREGIATIISAPIKSGDSVIGVLRLYFSTTREFYEDEIMMINAFAHQAGLAIKNATDYLAMETDLKDLKNDTWSHRSWF